jgi:glutamate 5-kinase
MKRRSDHSTSSTSAATTRSQLAAARRVVVKLGSAVIAPDGVLSESHVAALAADIASCFPRGIDVVIVTSGAVASGFRSLGLDAMPRTIAEKQAAAAVGQSRLMSAWAAGFAAHQRAVGQVLLTGDDFDHARRSHNARTTLLTLLARGVVPIINENDSVSFEEIKLGDNDRLSALVTGLIGAHALIILSTAAGVYEHGREGPNARVIHEFFGGVADAYAHVRTGKSGVGTGGMSTKLDAVAIAGDAGAVAVISAGATQRPVSRVLAGETLGTVFAPPQRTKSTRRRHIAYAARVRGTLVIDDGAGRAILERGASLLPAGVVEVQGEFAAKQTVEIRGRDGVAIARGICAYDSAEVRKIRGLKTSAIEKALGYVYAEEVVHRNDLVVLPVMRARSMPGSAL